MIRIKWILCCLVFAFSTFALAHTFRAEKNSIFINEVRVITLRATQGGLSPARRASLSAIRFKKAGELNQIIVKKVGKTHQIWLGKKVVLVIGREEALAQRSTTADLAAAWAEKIQNAAAMPPLKLSEDFLRLGEQAQGSVELSGTRALKATVQSADTDIVVVQRVRGGLRLKATGIGTANVTIQAGDVSQTLMVEVAPYAAQFPQKVVATVVGYPATVETVKQAAIGALKTQFKGRALVEWQAQDFQVQPLEVGDSKEFRVRVNAEADQCLPASGVVSIQVHNEAISYQPETVLWYCNDPENVKAPGPLFSASLRKAAPARLLYHHINDSYAPLYTKVELINTSSESARLLIIPGDSRPDKNPVLAGLIAGDQFIRAWTNRSGEVLVIPARSSIPLSLRRLGPQDTMSGLCYLRLLDGPEQVAVKVDALAPFPLDARWEAALNNSRPWQEVGSQPLRYDNNSILAISRAIYPDPFKNEILNYNVGGRYGFVRIGQKPILRADQTEKLFGNFGVVYDIKALAQNPTDIMTDLEVVFEASAGYSGAVFVVNGQTIRTPLLQPKTEYQIANFKLNPGASKELRILTVPLSGSSYPATITLRPTKYASMGVR